MTSGNKYIRGMNTQGQTAIEVAQKIASSITDETTRLHVQQQIVRAIADAVYAMELASFNEYEKYGGWTSLVDCAEAWKTACEAADEIDPEWFMGSGTAVKCFIRRFIRT